MYAVSAETTAVHKFYFVKSNLQCARFIKLAVVLKRGNEWRDLTSRLRDPTP